MLSNPFKRFSAPYGSLSHARFKMAANIVMLAKIDSIAIIVMVSLPMFLLVQKVSKTSLTSSGSCLDENKN